MGQRYLCPVFCTLRSNYHFDEVISKKGITFPYELRKGRTDSRDGRMMFMVAPTLTTSR